MSISIKYLILLNPKLIFKLNIKTKITILILLKIRFEQLT